MIHPLPHPAQVQAHPLHQVPVPAHHHLLQVPHHPQAAVMTIDLECGDEDKSHP